MALSIRTDGEAVGLAAPSRRGTTGAWWEEPVVLRLVSIAAFVVADIGDNRPTGSPPGHPLRAGAN